MNMILWICFSILLGGLEPSNSSAQAGAIHPFRSYDPDNIFYPEVFSYHRVIKRADTSYLCTEAYNKTVVVLQEQGSSVSFKARDEANTILLRYSLPFPTDRTASFTLNVYINGAKAGAFILSSYYMHNKPYMDNQWLPCPPSEDPGTVQRWWDETWIKGIPIHPGDTITIKKDPENLAPEYYLDIIDLELVEPPVPKPDSSWISITDFGATPNDMKDDREAILRACNSAATGTKKVWIPEGRYIISTRITLTKNHAGLTIAGAGMWHSEVYLYQDVRDQAMANHVFYVEGKDITIRNLLIHKKSNFRRFSAGTGLGGRVNSGNAVAIAETAANFKLDSCWIIRSAVWNFGASYAEITNNRIRCSYIDGIHIDAPASFCRIHNNHIRYTGDDMLANLSKSHTLQLQTEESNQFTQNTCEINYMARTFIFVGGKKHQFTRNYFRHTAGPILIRTYDSMLGNVTQVHPIEQGLLKQNIIINEDPRNAIEINGYGVAPIHLEILENTIVSPKGSAVAFIQGSYAKIQCVLEGNTIVCDPHITPLKNADHYKVKTHQNTILPQWTGGIPLPPTSILTY